MPDFGFDDVLAEFGVKPTRPEPSEVETSKATHDEPPEGFSDPRDFGFDDVLAEFGVTPTESAKRASGGIPRGDDFGFHDVLAEFGVTPSKPELPKAVEPTAAAPSANAPGAFSRGLWSSIYSAPELAGESIEGLGRIFGSEALRGIGERLKTEKPRLGPEYTPKVGSISEVDSFDSLMTYLGESFGQGLGSTLPSLAAAVPGAAAGAVVGGPLGAAIGGGLAAFGPAYLMNAGDMRRQLREEGITDEKRSAEIAALAGLPISALDVAGLEGVFGSVTGIKRELGKSIAKSVAKAVAKGAASESSTEGIQQAIQEGVTAWAADKPFFQTERGIAVLDAMIGGGLVGGGLGGAGAGAVHALGRRGQQEEPQGQEEQASAAASSMPEASAAPSIAPGIRVAADLGDGVERLGRIAEVTELESGPGVRIILDSGEDYTRPLSEVKLRPLEGESARPSGALPPPPSPGFAGVLAAPAQPRALAFQPEPGTVYGEGFRMTEPGPEPAPPRPIEGEGFILNPPPGGMPRPALPRPATIYGEGFTANAPQGGSALDKALYAVRRLEQGEPVTNQFLARVSGLKGEQIKNLRDVLRSRGLVEQKGKAWVRAADIKAPLSPSPVLPGGVSAVAAEPQPEGTTLPPLGTTQRGEPATLVPEIEGASDTAVTAAGREVPVRYAVVEADDLIPSQLDDFSPNPAYPQALQPRDRTRPASQLQVQAIANNLNPRLLGASPRASDGAPIVARNGVVESGNGRVLAIRRAYAEGKAEGYRAFLRQEGFDVSGMRQPVLVRIRQGEMSPEERLAFTREANERETLSLSATEQALADARTLPRSVLELYRGGDVTSAANRAFVTAFIRDVAGENERARMLTPDGGLSVEGRRRIEGALLGKAYGDPAIIGALLEDPDPNIKGIGNALVDVAGLWALMREEARARQINPAVDITSHLVEAVKLVQRARTEGRGVAEYVAQRDMFSGTIPRRTEALLRVFFRNEGLASPRSRERIARDLRFYVTEARKTKPEPGLLGASDVVGPDQLLEEVHGRREREEGATGSGTLFGRRPHTEPDVDESRAVGRGPDRGSGGAEARGHGAEGRREGVTAPQRPADYGASNKVFTKEAADRAREALRRKLSERFRPADRTSAYDPKRRRVAEVVAAEVRRLAPGLGVDVVERLASGGETIWGRYLDGIVSVSLASPDPVRTARHEVIHALRELGVITPDEWAILRRAAERNWIERYDVREKWRTLYEGMSPELAEEVIAEEAVAEAFADFTSGNRRFPPGIRRLFEKLKAFFQRVASALRGLGFTRPEDVFDRIESGAVGTRQAQRELRTGRAQVAGASVGPSVARAPSRSSSAQKEAASLFMAARNAVRRFFDPLSGLPMAREYLIARSLTAGKVGAINRLVAETNDAFSGASPEEGRAIYDYLTTAGADPSRIRDEQRRAAAVSVKRRINRIGRELVSRGLLSQEAYEAHRDAYLPRLYLKHVLDMPASSAGVGRRISRQGYLKERQDIPAEVRELLLGEIKDPGFLASYGIGVPLRDFAIIDFLDQIAGNSRWAREEDVVNWRGRRVSLFWLSNEAKELRSRARLIDANEPGRARQMRLLAEEMERIVDARAVEAGIDNVPDGWERIPDSKRYGMLRGMVVRKEIANDLKGAFHMIDPDAPFLQKLFEAGGIGTKITQAWKLGKVALNPGSQARNFVSNAFLLHLSGVPIWRVPERLAQALGEMRRHGRYWRVAQKYGIAEGTFSSNELLALNKQLLDIKAREGGVLPKLMKLGATVARFGSSAYQASESLFKIASIIDSIERRRMSEEDAALHAQKWLFDYSLVSPTIRYLRNAPVGGMPFITFQVKVLPILVEVARTRPWAFLPYVAIGFMAAEAFKAEWDVDDEDLERLRKALPDYIREKGAVLPLPYKNEHGRWRFFDASYFLPWGQLQEIARQVVDPDWKTLFTDTGLLGAPITSLIAAVTTNVDPFTKREIANPFDPPSAQVYDWITYLWRLAMPTFITDIGPVGVPGIIPGHIERSLRGLPTRDGQPGMTVSDAFARLLGVNIYTVDVDRSRAENLQRMESEINRIRSRMMYEVRDARLSPEERKAKTEAFVALLQRKIRRMGEYAEETAPSEKLRAAAARP